MLDEEKTANSGWRVVLSQEVARGTYLATCKVTFPASVIGSCGLTTGGDSTYSAWYSPKSEGISMSLTYVSLHNFSSSASLVCNAYTSSQSKLTALKMQIVRLNY